MSNRKSFSPNGIDGVNVVVRAFDGAEIDITENVLSFSIFESIFSPFLFGKLTVLDNSAMLSVLPFIGQEQIIFSWERNEEVIEKIFYSTGVENVVPQLNTRATYEISFTSESQFRNAVNMFSRSYTQTSDQIISSIYSEFLESDLKVETRGNTSYNVVFPYMKPFQAINTVIKNTIAVDQTPMFLFDRFYEEENSVVLTSYGQMFDQDPIADLSTLKTVNNINEQNQPIELYQVYSYNVMKAFKTLDQISAGAYSAIQRTFDISSKGGALDQQFYFKDSAPAPGNSWIKDSFEFDKSVSRRINVLQDRFAFDNKLPNLHNVDSIDSLILKSFMNRFSSIVIDAAINPIAYTVDDIPFTVGKTVDFTVPIFTAITDSFKSDNFKNKILSGKYLITSIRHQMNNREYTMSIELSRDYVGEESIL
jgi:hypothetical protein